MALPLVGFFLLWNSKSLLSKKIIIRILISVVVVITTIISFPQTRVRHRVDQAVSNIHHYYDDTNKGTSIALRFDMWKSAWYMFESSPIIGMGNDESFKEKQIYVKEGLVGPGLLQFLHAHNEYLTSLSLRGVLGLFFLLFVYLVPLKLFLKKIREYDNNWHVKSYAIAGAIIPISYMHFEITQSLFYHNIGVMMYALPILFLWAAVRWAERGEV